VFCVSVKVKLSVPLLYVCVHSAWKGHFIGHFGDGPKMTYTVSGGTLNPTHSLTLIVVIVVAVDACRCRWAYYVLCENTNYSAIYELYEL